MFSAPIHNAFSVRNHDFVSENIFLYFFLQSRGIQLSKKSNDIKIASPVNSVEFLEQIFFFGTKKKDREYIRTYPFKGMFLFVKPKIRG